MKWAFGFPGDTIAFAQPALVGGRVFVGSAGEAVYSLDASTGCAYWKFKAEAAVRTAISVGEASVAGKRLAYFGDQQATVYAIDALTGAKVWSARLESFPAAVITGAPLFLYRYLRSKSSARRMPNTNAAAFAVALWHWIV